MVRINNSLWRIPLLAWMTACTTIFTVEHPMAALNLALIFILDAGLAVWLVWVTLRQRKADCDVNHKKNGEV